MQATIEDAVERWVDAGLIDGDTAAAIRAFEDDDRDVPPTGDVDATPDDARVLPRGRAGLVAEGLAYLGAVLAFGAGLVLFGELWDGLGGIARTATAGSATLALAGAAAALGDPDTAPVRRLGALLAALAVVGVGLTTGVALEELTPMEADRIAFSAGALGLLVAVPVHTWRASWPTTLALGAGLLTTLLAGESVVGLADSPVAPGLTLVGVGLAWASLGWAGWLRPRTAFEVTGLLAGGVGVQLLAIETFPVAALVVGLVVAVAVLAVGLLEQRTTPAVLGGLGITVFAPQLVVELFGDTVGGPLALFVGGVTLVGVAVVVLRQQVSR